MILVDANLLIYAHSSNFNQHAAARASLDEQMNGLVQIGLPWICLLAFLRITTNPRLFPRPHSIAKAWEQVSAWLACDNVWVPSPTDRHASILAGLLVHGSIHGDLVTDAHLAALAIEHGLFCVRRIATSRDSLTSDGSIRSLKHDAAGWGMTYEARIEAAHVGDAGRYVASSHQSGYVSCMRTTLTVDDDVAAILNRLRRKGDASLKAIINEALRRGLRAMAVPAKPRRPFRIQPIDVGRMLLPDIDNVAEVLALVEGDAYK